MSRKVSDFIFSFGVMVLGVGAVLLASVTIAPRSLKPAKQPVAIVLPAGAQSSGGDLEVPVIPVARPAVPLLNSTSSFSRPLTAIAVLVVDDKTSTVLFNKQSSGVRPLASLTKLMSALVLLDLPINWQTTTTVTEEDSDGSSHHVAVGEVFTLEDLWHIALIGSSNSSIAALVRASGLKEDQFVARMNEKATALRLPSLRFVEPTGLNSGNVGNAYDVARLLRFAHESEKIDATLRVGEYYAHPLNKAKPRRVWSTDWLITNWVPNTFLKDSIVGKTGYTAEAGYNFVVRLADDKGRTIRAAILGAASNEARFTEARDLAEWVFDNFLWPDEPGYDKLAE